MDKDMMLSKDRETTPKEACKTCGVALCWVCNKPVINEFKWLLWKNYEAAHWECWKEYKPEK